MNRKSEMLHFVFAVSQKRDIVSKLQAAKQNLLLIKGSQQRFYETGCSQHGVQYGDLGSSND